MDGQKEMTDQQRIEDIIDIAYELHSREVSNNILYERFSGISWNDMCTNGAKMFRSLMSCDTDNKSSQNFVNQLVEDVSDELIKQKSPVCDIQGNNLWYEKDVADIVREVAENLLKGYKTTQNNSGLLNKWVVFRQDGMEPYLHGRIYYISDAGCCHIKCKNGRCRFKNKEELVAIFDNKKECYDYK